MASPEATPVKHSGSEAGDSATGTNNVSASAEDAPQIATMNELQTASSTFEQTQPPQSRLLAKRGASGDFSLDGLILFDLTSKPGAHDAFSPHCIKTIVDLRILGVQGFERSRLTFTQIREDLAEKIGHPGVTVPTLELADGSHLTDSWKISEYLESKHPAGHLLFPSTTVKRLAASLNETGRSLLAPHLSALCLPKVADLLDADSKRYFIERKLGPARFHKLASLSRAEQEAHIQGAVKVLATVEAALACAPSRSDGGRGSSQWLADTSSPSHADACLYGWYVYSRAAGADVARTIWHVNHPHLSSWILAMDNWLGQEITSDFLN